MTADHRPAPFLAKIALALVSVLCVFFVAEVALRLVPPPRMHEVVTTPRAMSEKWKDLPKFTNGGMRALSQPGARGTAHGALIETNAAGLRGPERPQQKPPGTFRIALIGDSVTIGWGVLQEETYAALAEARLNATRSDQAYEVLNIGMSGYNTERVVSRLRHRGMPFDPDLFVYGFTVNDVEGPNYEKLSKAGFRNPLRYEASPSRLWRVMGPRIDAVRDTLWPQRGSYTHELFYNYFENPEAWADVERGLDELRGIADRRDACVLVLIHTHLSSLRFMHPFHPLYEKISASAEARGFAVTDSWDEHSGVDERTLWVATFDHHPNAQGHALLADALMTGLQDLPASCW